MKQLSYATICLTLLLLIPGCETDSGVFGVSRTISPGDEVAVVDTSSDLGQLFGLSATDKVVAVGLGNNCTIHDTDTRGGLAGAPFGRVKRGEYGRFVALFQVSDASGAFTKARFLGVVDPRGSIVDESIARWDE